jgi:hypothetical protein
MTGLSSRTATDLGIVSTLADAVVELLRGNRKTGALLLGAAALSRKIPGLGVAVSVALRVVRKFR